jgi:rod shape determining protein RodA
MRNEVDISGKLDWVTVLLYILLVALGWINIFAAVYDETANQTIWDLSLNSGRQLIFIAASVVIIFAIIIIDMRFYETFAYLFYGIILFVLLLIPIIGKEVGGNKSWIGVGSFGVQPSEFAKFITALAVAKFIGSVGFKMDNLRNQLILTYADGDSHGTYSIAERFWNSHCFCLATIGLLPRGHVTFSLDCRNFNGHNSHTYVDR